MVAAAFLQAYALLPNFVVLQFSSLQGVSKLYFANIWLLLQPQGGRDIVSERDASHSAPFSKEATFFKQFLGGKGVVLFSGRGIEFIHVIDREVVDSGYLKGSNLGCPGHYLLSKILFVNALFTNFMNL